MTFEDLSLTLFVACNGIRIFAYVPQIHKAAIDENGAAAISCTTWFLFLIANLSTIAYALVNRSDWGLAACFMANAVCCVAILAITFYKRHAALRKRLTPNHALMRDEAGRSATPTAHAGAGYLRGGSA
jgi:hypothetical protein